MEVSLNISQSNVGFELNAICSSPGGLLLQKAEFSFTRSQVVVKPTFVQRINISAKPIADVRSPVR